MPVIPASQRDRTVASGILIRATNGAHNALLDLEELDEKALDAFRNRYEALAREARRLQNSGGIDTDSPEA